METRKSNINDLYKHCSCLKTFERLFESAFLPMHKQMHTVQLEAKPAVPFDDCVKFEHSLWQAPRLQQISLMVYVCIRMNVGRGIALQTNNI